MRARLDLDYFGLTGDSEHFQSELKVANFLKRKLFKSCRNFLPLKKVFPINFNKKKMDLLEKDLLPTILIWFA